MPLNSLCICDHDPFTNKKYSNYIHQIQNIGGGNVMVSFSSWIYNSKYMDLNLGNTSDDIEYRYKECGRNVNESKSKDYE